MSFGAGAAAFVVAVSSPVFAQVPRGQDAAAFYQTSCASCHDGGADRAPNRDALRAMNPERVLRALESGPMISMATGLYMLCIIPVPETSGIITIPSLLIIPSVRLLA